MYGVYNNCLGYLNASTGIEATENCTNKQVFEMQECWWKIPPIDEEQYNQCTKEIVEPAAPECAVCIAGYSMYGTPPSDVTAPCHPGAPNMTGASCTPEEVAMFSK